MKSRTIQFSDHRSSRSILMLILSILLFGMLAAIIWYFPPTQEYHLLIVTIPVIPVVLGILGAFVFCTTTYIFKSKIHGILTAMVVVTYLIFRENSLTHPFFGLLLLALFLVLELLFTYRK
jgi:hypothetical protein